MKSIQYHHSILRLLKVGDLRSAAALARDVVDNMYVALWVNGCASSDQVNKIKADDRFPVTYPEIFEQVDSKYKENAYFSELKGRCAPLYSYNRSGILKLGLWSLGSHVDLHDEHLGIHRVVVGDRCKAWFHLLQSEPIVRNLPKIVGDPRHSCM
jgi:hypothetical protein